MDLTRDSNQTIIERLKREAEFARALLNESSLHLLNRKLDLARAELLLLVTALDCGDNEVKALLQQDSAATVEQLNAIYDVVWAKLIRDDPTQPRMSRAVNWRKFTEAHKDDPDEGCIAAGDPGVVAWFLQSQADTEEI